MIYRYALLFFDFFVILDDNKEYLDKLITIIDDFLKERLKLSLHPDKIMIKKHHQGIDFLGYVKEQIINILKIKLYGR